MRARRLFVVSLGCPKNLVDTETMLGRLLPSGYAIEADPKRADAILINTCSFIEPARRESLDAIAECLGLKRRGKAKAVIVTGCMPQSHRELLEERFPEIDAFLNLEQEAGVVETLNRLLLGRKGKKARAQTTEGETPSARLLLTPTHTAYLRISDGCSHGCSFCTIPKIRGPHLSRPMDDIVAEARDLAAAGTRELNLIAQDTSAYGLDTEGRRLLPALLEQLCAVDGLDWIRLMYAYPSGITDKLIESIGWLDKVVPYLDLPFQHASERVLKAMRRPASHAYLEGLIEKLRAGISEISLRSTFIVGFPGETNADFERLMEFCRAMQFDHAGCFIYSNEEKAASAGLPDPVPPEVQEERAERLAALLTEVSEKKVAERVGIEADVLIDADSDVFPDYLRGRHSGQAPDIDGVVYVPRASAEAGQLVRCRLTAAQGYDLFAELV